MPLETSKKQGLDKMYVTTTAVYEDKGVCKLEKQKTAKTYSKFKHRKTTS